MVTLIFNALLRIQSDELHGFYRVVAVPHGSDTVWLAYAGPWLSGENDETPPASSPTIGSVTERSRAEIHWLEQEGKLVMAEGRPPGKLLLGADQLEQHELTLWQTRQQQTMPFFNHELLCEALGRTRGIGPLVRMVLGSTSASRATVYRLWQLLCMHGFESGSLIPRFELCGAAGVPRPVNEIRKKAGAKCLRERLGEPVLNPQLGLSESDRMRIALHYQSLARPGLSKRQLYEQLIERAFVTLYQDTERGRVPILPPLGTYPNQRQVRHAIEYGVTKLERRRLATTKGHFDRNIRGLRGRAYKGVTGPGYCYAIDSTIGDIHLRSSIQAAWILGRPIVYFVVDVWSTAIVGFFVALRGPSWDMAKLALFSTACDPRLLAKLWGFEFVPTLVPTPTLPFMVMSDRGEYLSAGARETCLELGATFSLNPAYRPDLKGMVEVLHRILKDEQYPFLPGAIDRRRRELELSGSNPNESVLTLRDYVHYLVGVVNHFNLFADRSDRMTSEMIAAGVEPTPAGLWRFGFDMGIGYQKAIGQDRLMKSLLIPGQAVSRRNGVYFESLQYDAPIVHEQQWSAVARNEGVARHQVLSFPAACETIWWPNPTGQVCELTLNPDARAPATVSVDEWRDALAYDRMKRDDRQHKRLQAAITKLTQDAERIKQATAVAREADAAYVGPKPNLREVRVLENLPRRGEPEFVDEQPAASAPDAGHDAYAAVMDEVFASINEESAC